MKILYHHRTQANDGQAVHIRALQRAFRETGHVVEEVGLVDQGAEAPDRAEPGRSKWAWVTRLPRFMLELAEYSYSLVARRRIVAAARRFQPDLIYERYAFGNFGGVAAARQLGLPLVLEVNSPLVDELSLTRGLTLKKLARRIETGILNGASIICVVTRVLGDLLIDLGADPDKILVTPNGVHPAAFDYESLGGRALLTARARRAFGLPSERGAGEVVLGFVGYFRAWHRLDLVLQMLAEPGFEALRFVIIGEGPVEAELREQATQLGVAERVCFAGPQPHDQIPVLLPGFDVALMPAINAYASALKLHEYMAAGLAIIAPDQPNLKEVVAENVSALLVPPGDLAALKRAAARLLSDPDLAARLGAAAAAAIQTQGLTWQANAHRVIEAVSALPPPTR